VEPQAVANCEEPCEGTVADLQHVRSRMLSESSAGELAEWFKALSDPTRVRMIDALMQKELCVHDLSVLLDMNQSAVSHQLRYLRNIRMVKRRKDGKTVYYSLDDAHIEEMFHATLQHLRHK